MMINGKNYKTALSERKPAPSKNSYFLEDSTEGDKQQINDIIAIVLKKSEHKPIKLNVNISRNYFNSSINNILSATDTTKAVGDTRSFPNLISKIYLRARKFAVIE